eukprot:scaffold80861_cov29-Tisochrysis_lutea.AAC.2
MPPFAAAPSGPRMDAILALGDGRWHAPRSSPAAGGRRLLDAMPFSSTPVRKATKRRRLC